MRPCPELRRFADTVCAAYPPELHYFDFWREFPPDEDSSIRTMFRALFGGLSLRKPLAIRSVFPHHRRHTVPQAELGRDRCVQVAFSGEARHLEVDDFDLNLIMAPDDPARKVVSYLSFAAQAHEFGLWPLLLRRRPLPAREKFCVAVVSNHESGLRGRFLMRLHARKRIDSCGRWLNTAGFFAPFDEQEFGDRYFPFLQQYKFMVCFENTRRSHYLTEKLANAYAAGCVPVYWGAPEARSWLNGRAFLSLEDDSDAAMDALISRMLELDADQLAYAEVHAEPLLTAGIPERMRIETIRDNLARVLRRSRPDAF